MKKKIVVLLGIIMALSVLLCACGGNTSQIDNNPNEGKIQLTDELKIELEEYFGNEDEATIATLIFEAEFFNSNYDVTFATITDYEQEDDYNYKVWVVYTCTDHYGNISKKQETINAYFVEDSESEEGYKMKRGIPHF